MSLSLGCFKLRIEVNVMFSKEGDMKEADQQKNIQKVREMLFLSVAYAASCGGVGTLTGTGPNLVLKERFMKILFLLNSPFNI